MERGCFVNVGSSGAAESEPGFEWGQWDRRARRGSISTTVEKDLAFTQSLIGPILSTLRLPPFEPCGYPHSGGYLRTMRLFLIRHGETVDNVAQV